MSLLFEAETHQILGACFEVYREKGCGFLEDVYHECLEIEFGLRAIPFVSRIPLDLEYKGMKLRKKYEPDFFCCFEQVVLEIKAAKSIDDSHRAQLMNYLRATNTKVGLLVNFGHYPKAQFERFAL
ncbi:MAG: GxxExxY protein [Verrucomicrobiaceae bacterium]|nr:MAG: GxxExxY protein [Verrucomicrobiaceae bacterium]